MSETTPGKFDQTISVITSKEDTFRYIGMQGWFNKTYDDAVQQDMSEAAIANIQSIQIMDGLLKGKGAFTNEQDKAIKELQFHNNYGKKKIS